jgi:predicted transcriptional regulator
MTEISCRLLAATVARYDETGEPVGPRSVARDVEESPEVVADRFDRYVGCALLTPTDGGYRPTVTARELLALDCEGDVLIVDPAGKACKG